MPQSVFVTANPNTPIGGVTFNQSQCQYFAGIYVVAGRIPARKYPFIFDSRIHAWCSGRNHSWELGYTQCRRYFLNGQLLPESRVKAHP